MTIVVVSLALFLAIGALLASVSQDERFGDLQWLQWLIRGVLGIYTVLVGGLAALMTFVAILFAIETASGLGASAIPPLDKFDYSPETMFLILAVLTNILVVLLLGLFFKPLRAKIYQLFGQADVDSLKHQWGATFFLSLIILNISMIWPLYSLEMIIDGLKESSAILDTVVLQVVLMGLAIVGTGIGITRTPAQAWERLGITKLSRKDWAMCGLWALGLAAVMGFYSEVVMQYVFPDSYAMGEKIHEALLAREGASPLPWLEHPLVLMLVIPVGAGFSEEFIFRGLLQPIFGLWPTTLAFAIIHSHYGVTPMLAAVFAMGLVFGYLRNRYNLVAAIAVHIGYDFLAIFQAVAMKWLMSPN